MKMTAHGFIHVDSYQTYYEVYGKPNPQKRPLLVIHGGPGSAHNYLLGLAELARHDRQVIFYDQLGCGLSDHPVDDRLWTINTFLRELTALREQLGLTDIDLYGHSWGGMLAISYLLSQPKPQAVHSVILASSMISLPLYNAEVDSLKQALGPDTYKLMITNEAAGTTDTPAYQQAYARYSAKHLYSGPGFPSELLAPMEPGPSAAYQILWGVNEASATGTLVAWDMVDRLHEIDIPCLVMSGKNDELTPHQAELTHIRIAGSELAIFMGGTHLVHIEQPDKYRQRLEQFLDSV